MKKILATILVVILALSLAACGENSQQPQQNADNGTNSDDYGMVETEEGYYQEFEFYNNTEQTIVEIYASAGGSNQWRDNMLDGTQIGPQQATPLSIYIIPGDTTDFRVVAENGAEHELRGYELEKFSVMELVVNDDGSATILLSSPDDAGEGTGKEDENEDFAEGYAARMNEHVAAFEELMNNSVAELMNMANTLETEDELIEWCQAFYMVKDAIGEATDKFAAITEDVPAEYQEAHINITIAEAAVYDALTGFENAVDAAINGDQDAFNEGLGTFIGNLQAAEELWDKAVQ